MSKNPSAAPSVLKGETQSKSLHAGSLSFFDQTLNMRSRLALLLAAIILLPVYFFPLWNMTFRSNQYTDGLVLHIYAFELQGGKTPNRDDLREINSLNHYIGMRPLLESDFSEFIWLPFAIGALMLLTLRALVIGKMANVIDVFVLFSYFGLFSLWSFYHRLYSYGHNLDPTAAIKVAPFTPPLLGAKQIANFSVTSYPGIAALSLVAFSLLLITAILLSTRRTVSNY